MINQKEVYMSLCERLRYPPSPYLLKILEKMITPEEGLILLELPEAPHNIAKKVNLKEEKVRQKLNEFLQRGLVVSTKRGLQLAREVTQLHDASLASDDRFIDQELLDLWKEFYEAEWCQSLAKQWQTMKEPMCGVIPLWRSLQKSSQIPSHEILHEEDMKEIIKAADCIAVVSCPCRKPLRRCDAPLDVCMQFNKWAQYAIDRGAGRKVFVEEAIKINDLAEENGLVHVQPRVTPSLSLICNCCGDCCALLDPCLTYGGMENALEKSRYRARINQDLCTECYDCVDRCPFRAIEKNESLTSDVPKVNVDQGKCFGCGVCVIGCPSDALAMSLTDEK